MNLDRGIGIGIAEARSAPWAPFVVKPIMRVDGRRTVSGRALGACREDLRLAPWHGLLANRAMQIR